MLDFLKCKIHDISLEDLKTPAIILLLLNIDSRHPFTPFSGIIKFPFQIEAQIYFYISYILCIGVLKLIQCYNVY